MNSSMETLYDIAMEKLSKDDSLFTQDDINKISTIMFENCIHEPIAKQVTKDIVSGFMKYDAMAMWTNLVEWDEKFIRRILKEVGNIE